MQAVENRTVAFSLPRPIIKNATAQFSRLLQFFKGAPLRGAFFRACMRGDRVQGIYGSGWEAACPCTGRSSLLLLQRGVRSGQACDRHAVR